MDIDYVAIQRYNSGFDRNLNMIIVASVRFFSDLFSVNDVNILKLKTFRKFGLLSKRRHRTACAHLAPEDHLMANRVQPVAV